MTIVLDANVVLGLIDADDELHAQASAFYASVEEDLVTTPLVVAEMDHLVTRRTGTPGTDHLWSSLEANAIGVRWWATAMTETLAIARSRPALGLGDASLIALAPVVRSTRIATFDRPHFATARTADGTPFTLLP